MDLSEPLRAAGQEEEASTAPCDAQVPSVALLRWRRRAITGAGAILGLVTLVLVGGLSLVGGSLSSGLTVHVSDGIVDIGPQQVDPIVMSQKNASEGTHVLGCDFWCVEHGVPQGWKCQICGMWLNTWTAQIDSVCRKNHIKQATCEEITHAFLDKRWKVYLYFWIFLFIIWLVWFTARRWTQQFPSYWKNKWDFRNIGACFSNWRDFHELVCLYDALTNQRARERDETLRKQIQDLFNWTTQSTNMGVGFDGSFQTHKSFKVLKVERVENARNWKKYATYRSTTPTAEHIKDHLTGGLKTKAERAQSIIDAQQAAMRGTAGSPASRFIDSLRLDGSRNEVLLFHGSPGKSARDRNSDPPYSGVQFEGSSPLDAICYSGFDQRLGSSTGMLGSAIYLADKVSKADCYAGKYSGDGETTVGEKACIFISRVTLGCPYLAEHALNGIRRPPSTHEEFDIQLLFDETPFYSFAARARTTVKEFWKAKKVSGWSVTSSPHERFTSVISNNFIDGTTSDHFKRFYEYAVYHGTEAYPEFKVTYERMPESIPSGRRS